MDVPDAAAALRSEQATPRAGERTSSARSRPARSSRNLGGSEEFKRNADLCVHCNLCATECPAGVDVSSLMLEAKAAYVEAHGMPPGEWVISRLELWSRIASNLPILSGALLRSRPARWLMERLFGVSRLRRLPRPHRTPFTRRAARLGLTRARPQEPGPRVAFFVDVFARYFDQGARRDGRGRPPPSERQRLHPSRPAGFGDALARRRRRRPRPIPRPGQPPRPGQRGPRRLYGGLLRADRHFDAPPRVSQADRRS